MKPYKLFLEYDVVEFIENLSTTEQSSFHRLLRMLRDSPYNHSGYTESDQGRRIDVCIYRKHAVKYWIDEADGHIKVFEVIPADDRE